MSDAPVESFAPVWSADARVLILGSMPGVASLRAARYYAHPRNAFWEVVGGAVGAGPDRDYEERLHALRARGIALWDVARRCRRPGSLDAAIRDVEPNDLVALVRRMPELRAILCNGAKAHELLERTVLRARSDALGGVRVRRLPSTSPANASVSRREKARAWLQALRDAGVRIDRIATA